MIPDDRFIKHTLENWYFGVDFTGDLTKYHNHVDLVKKIGKNSIDLVTADGSVDCMSCPGEQEEFTSFLHYCETITALLVLRKGGSFVLKLFTIFEDTTICLLYLLNCLFNVTIFKPCSSKSGNSEIYVICTSYSCADNFESLLNNLIIPYKNGGFNNLSMFDLKDLPQSFLEQLDFCTKMFCERQMITIKNNIEHFQNPTVSKQDLHFLKQRVANKFIHKYNIKRIPNECKILKNCNVLTDYRNIKQSLTNFNTGFKRILVNNLIEHKFDNDLLNIVIGKRIEYVQNSKFMTDEDLKYFLNHKVTKNKNLYDLIVSFLNRKNFHVINLNDLNTISIYYKFQKQFFYKIFYSLNNCDHIFVQIPFVTHFFVGLIYILIMCYDEIIWHSNGLLVLHKINKSFNKVYEIFKKIHDIYETLEDNLLVNDIVQLICPEIFDRNMVFLNFICNYNHNIVLNLQ